jgi:hypothetical protein
MALGRVLRQREASGVTVPALYTLRERATRFPGGSYGVLG